MILLVIFCLLGFIWAVSLGALAKWVWHSVNFGQWADAMLGLCMLAFLLAIGLVIFEIGRKG